MIFLVIIYGSYGFNTVNNTFSDIQIEDRTQNVVNNCSPLFASHLWVSPFDEESEEQEKPKILSTTALLNVHLSLELGCFWWRAAEQENMLQAWASLKTEKEKYILYLHQLSKKSATRYKKSHIKTWQFLMMIKIYNKQLFLIFNTLQLTSIAWSSSDMGKDYWCYWIFRCDSTHLTRPEVKLLVTDCI